LWLATQITADTAARTREAKMPEIGKGSAPKTETVVAPPDSKPWYSKRTTVRHAANPTRRLVDAYHEVVRG
jgi:hypothetical protein